MPRAISLPREHGAYLTLVGATTAAVIVAPRPLAALGVGILTTAAFLARGVVERVAARSALRAWDRPWSVALVGAGVAGEQLAARATPHLALAIAALAIVGLVGAAIARGTRIHRDLRVEVAALGALGAAGGLAALAGGVGFDRALLLGAILGVHAAASVPLVRAEVRNQRGPGAALALVLIAAGVAVCIGLDRPAASLALAPRLVQWIALRRPRTRRTAPRTVGFRETAVLAIVIAIAALAI